MKRSGPRRLSRSPIRRPYTTALIAVVIYFILMLFSGGLINRSDQIVADMFICGGGLFFWLFFFAQFTLPLRTVEHRKDAFMRLMLYIFGATGPVVRVENGEILERKGEQEKSGPGVVILDTASAAVIRTPSAFKPAIGPGVYFTEAHEKIAGTVDLHIQKGGIGPLEEDDPFVAMDKNDPDPAILELRKRRFATQGLTRDGIEVVPRITVSVRLDVKQPEGKSRFGYSHESVEKAIKSQPEDLEDKAPSSGGKVDLVRLPLHLAADIWKECISRYTLEELFSSTPGTQTALQLITVELGDRLKKNHYQQTDEVGRSIVKKERPSAEFKMLSDRGIRVIGVTIPFLKFPAKVEEKILASWKSTWLIRAQQEREYIEQIRAYERERGRETATGVFIHRVLHHLGGMNPDARLDGDQILNQLVRGTIYLTERESYLHRLARDETQQLKELLEWCETRREV